MRHEKKVQKTCGYKSPKNVWLGIVGKKTIINSITILLALNEQTAND